MKDLWEFVFGAMMGLLLWCWVLSALALSGVVVARILIFFLDK